MYLTDTELKNLLPKFDFKFDEINESFDADAQIQPCSIDLRLDNVFWKFKGVGEIDLMQSKSIGRTPSRYWEKIILTHGKHITIKPGEILLGRTLEIFTIPDKYAGKIEGRSSFSRLGIAVNVNGGFINPGWTGHKSLQLVNYNKNTIRLYPKIPICQLLVSELNVIPENSYGNDIIQSKYMHGDGGPSYWWRDKRIESLRKALIASNISVELQNRLIEKLGPQEIEVMDRFNLFINRSKLSKLNNVEEVLKNFIDTETKRHKLQKILVNSPRVLFAGFLTLTLKFAHDLFISGLSNYLWYFIITLSLCIIMLIGLIYSFTYPTKKYINWDDLNRIDEIKH